MDKKEAAAQKFKERTAAKRFKLPEGDTTFRVLPNKKGLDRAEYIEYGMHSGVGARNAYLRCGKNAKGEGECWLCDTLIPKLLKSGKKSHQAAAEGLKRKDSFAVQIAYQVDGKWVGPTLWEMSPGVANKLLHVMSRRDVSHPEKGYNLTISRTGTTMINTKYGDIDRDDERSEVDEKVYAKLKSFGEVLRQYDEEQQKTEYYGHEQDDEPEEDEKKKPSDDDEPEEEETKPKKPSKKPAVEEEDEPAEEDEEEVKPKPGKKKPKVEEEDEGEGEEADEDIPNLEEEEEEVKPKSGKKKPKEEEEDEPGEPEEDEEEVKPKKSSKKPSHDEDEGEEEETKPKKSKKPSVEEDDSDE